MLKATIASCLLLAAPLLATDEIELVNGKVLTVDRVTEETYKEVVYKTLGGGEGRKPADQVMQVRHDVGHALLDDYVRGLEAMDKGDFSAAIGAFETALGDSKVVGRKTYAWVKQHARWREARSYASMAEHKKVVETLDRLLQEVPETFYYGAALLMKAQALAADGDVAAAENAYRDLAADVGVKGLPERWAREAELGLVLLDKSLKGAARQQKLQSLVEKNRNQYPTVASRANVEIGNAMVEAGDYAGARTFFQKIVEEGQADDATIAAAYAGLGDCAYKEALTLDDPASDSAKELFSSAGLAFLRVATMYKEEVQLVPYCMHYAAMSYSRLGDRDRALKIAARLAARFPRSEYVGKSENALNVKLPRGK